MRYSRDDAAYQIKLRTRHFAKRQLTWYKREPDVIYIDRRRFDGNTEDMCRFMSDECRKRGIESLKVVYSKEKPIRPYEDMSISCRQHCICPPGTARKCTERRDIPGSTAFVPSVVGLIIAGEIINDITGK